MTTTTTGLPAPEATRPRTVLVGTMFVSAAAFMAFVGVVIVYISRRAQARTDGAEWFPDGTIELGPATFVFATLILSIFTVQWAVQAVNNDDRKNALVALVLTGLFGAAVFNQLGEGAWIDKDDIENDTQRYAAQCQASLDSLMMDGRCNQPGDATMCSDPGGSNETDWAGTLWDFAKVVGVGQLPGVLLLLSDAFQLAWDPGSTTTNAYDNMRQVAGLRFPNNGDDFDAAAQANGTNR